MPGPPPLSVPEWLAPHPQAHIVSTRADSTQVAASYTASIPAADLVAHYERRLHEAGIIFQTRPDGSGASIDVMANKASAEIHIREISGASTVDVKYALEHDPPTSSESEPSWPPMRLEWPAWLQIPDARITSQRTNPAGRIGVGSEDTCPGDVIGQPSQGCLKRVYTSSLKLKDLYEQLDRLLEQNGYSTQAAGSQPYASLGLGKWVGDALASLTMRQYPDRRQPDRYRQLDIFLRQPGTPATTVEVTFLVKGGEEPSRNRDISGTWVFTHADDRFQGTIELKQSGSVITGTWRTINGKSEPDSSVAGQVNGNTVNLVRLVGSNQNYVLTLSADGSRMDGFGNGYFLNHTNLNMQRIEAATRTATAPAKSPKTALSFPPPRGTWKWTIQSVALRRGSEIKYSSFYYEAATDRSIEQPLSLPSGGEIVGVFPNDCTFSAKDQSGASFTFRNEDEAKARGLGPGTWSVYPLKCGGVAVFVK